MAGSKPVWNWLVALSLIAIGALAGSVVWGLATGWSNTAGIAGLGSTLSALVALLISLRSQWRDKEIRQAEKLEVAADRAQQRRGVAMECSAEIEGWRLRNDLTALLTDLQKVSIAETPVMNGLRGSLEVSLLARSSIVKSGDAPPAHLLDSIDRVSRRIARELALGTIHALPGIPATWTTQFRTDVVGILGPSAPRFFVAMSTVWTNLILMAQQIETADDVAERVRRRQWSHVRTYLDAVTHEIVAFRELLLDFIKSADTCARVLAEHDDRDALSELRAPLDSMKKLSRQAFQRMAEVRSLTSLEDALDDHANAERRSLEFKTEIADALKGVERSIQANERLRASAKQTLSPQTDDKTQPGDSTTE